MYRCSASILAVCVASSIMALACTTEDPLPAADVRSQISSDLAAVLHETNIAIAGTRGVLPRPSALSLFERALGIDTPIAQAVRALGARLAVEPAMIDVTAAIAYLDDHLFDDASYLGGGVYQVSPSLLCTRTAADPGGSAPQTVDAACAAQIARLDLRIRTTIGPIVPGGDPTDRALVFAVQLGADRGEPLTVTLSHSLLGPSLTITALTITADLDALQRTLGELAPAIGPSLPKTELSGQLTARIQTDPTGASAWLTIERPISITLVGASADVDGPDAFALSSQPSKVFDIVLAPVNPGGALFLRLADTTVKLPARADGKRIELDLAGLTADAALVTYLPLLVNHLGIGDRAATVSVNGVRAQTIDINPQDGRDFNVIVQPDEADHSLDTLRVTPKLDLQVTTDHAVLGDAAPVYDITRVLLDGSLRDTAVPDRVEVTAGSFLIATSPAGHGFSAAAGQCVTGTEATDPNDAPLLQWTVGICN